MGCEHAQAAGGQTSPSQFEENTLSEVKRVIAVLSGKGGVGKSFVTGAIATELARHGHKVGVLDADITGPSIPKMFGMSGRHVHALGNLRRRRAHRLPVAARRRHRHRHEPAGSGLDDRRQGG